jgi:hypothetical protein
MDDPRMERDASELAIKWMRAIRLAGGEMSADDDEPGRPLSGDCDRHPPDEGRFCFMCSSRPQPPRRIPV